MYFSNSTVFLLAAMLFLCGALGAESGGPTTIESEGLLLPGEEVKLAARTEGVIDKVLVIEGQKVRAGQPLLQVDGKEQELRVRFAEEQAKKSNKDMESARKLYEEKLISRTERERVELEASSASASLELNRLQLENHTLRSPIDGYVMRMTKKAGESIARGELVAEIVNTETISVMTYLEARHLHNIELGRQVEIEPILPPGTKTLGVVVMVDPVVDAGTGIFRVKIQVNNPDDFLKTGTRAKIRF
jgi:membrane fusion protein, multidrug efflux system